MADDNLHEGLEDVIVAETRLSDIDGDSGQLVIAGVPVDELARTATYEETLYRLYFGDEPTDDELEAFREELAQYRAVPQATLDVVRAAAEASVDPMDALRMGTATVSLDQPGKDTERDRLVLVARFPAIVAAYWRVRNGEEPLEPREDLSHAANYLYLLTGEEPTDAQVRGLETYLNAVVDHGLNASTFTARTIVSTESDLVSAITGAVGALKGPLHGGAPGPVLDMLFDLQDAEDVEGAIRERLEAGERLMGFGHRVYTVRDPRAGVLADAAEAFYRSDDGDEAFFDLATSIEELAVDLLEEYKPGRRLETNVEFYTAVLLHGVGIPKELFSATFAVSRVGGWTAHCSEQLENNRLIRPRARYVGDGSGSSEEGSVEPTS